MNKPKTISLILILVGILFVIFGGIDDSPGSQLIGVVLIILVVAQAIRGLAKENRYRR